MNLKKLLGSLDFSLSEEDKTHLEKKARELSRLLKEKTKKLGADVFFGGSFAKDTIVRGGEYDIDIFIRFDKHIPKEFGKRLSGLKSGEIKLIKGSRDYFRIKDGDITFEIIPVMKIRSPKQAQNITDLSYFHVSYTKKHLNRRLKKEIGLAKKFCKARGVYGAESYIQGFSGYALECLIIYYKTFERMLKDMIKVKIGERKIIDIEKMYKKKEDIFIEMNESKVHSPVVLVDPTWKERNVLAGLSWETFRKFQKSAEEFLKNPSEKFFEVKKFNLDELKRKVKKSDADFLHLTLQTDRQEGDIAGTKLKKFARFLIREIERYFYVVKWEFYYSGKGREGELYLVLKSRGEIVRVGPPLNRAKDVKAFRNRNKNTFVSKGRIYAKIKIDFSARKVLENYYMKNKTKIKDMGIKGVELAQ